MLHRIILKYLTVYLGFVLIFALQKPLFLVFFHSLEPAIGVSDYFSVILHALPMDCSMAGYLSIIPGFLLVWETWCPASKALRTTEICYFFLAALLVWAAAMLNIGLYDHWGFPLDATPIFYFTSSPSAAMASVGLSEALLTAGLTVFFVWITLKVFTRTARIKNIPPEVPRRRRIATTVTLLVMTGLLFIPIRGGFTVSTMNPSRSYYSPVRLLNHAAVNPLFSLMYSLSHQHDFSGQFHTLAPEEASRIMQTLSPVAGDSTTVHLLTARRPDICMIILESFSSHLMPSLGGEAIATGLDSVAREGILFSNIYASSFRTDRALPAIIGGFPAQPTTSLMKLIEKTEHLPALPDELRRAGWDTRYYYGGDANFTNMSAYLINSGFNHIVSDRDFSLRERSSKWGAHDHLLFGRAAREIIADTAGPTLRVIQTSSSHEPFQVPFKGPFADERCNAFAYTDSCLTDFLEKIKQAPRYDSTLVVIVPDHFGAYPRNLQGANARHSIPLVLTGGALRTRALRIDTIGAQTDIAATLLAQLGLDTQAFTFSKNMLGAHTPKYAFFTDASSIAFTGSDGLTCVLDTETLMPDPDQTDGPQYEPRARAFIQKLYDYIDGL